MGGFCSGQINRLSDIVVVVCFRLMLITQSNNVHVQIEVLMSSFLSFTCPKGLIETRILKNVHCRSFKNVSLSNLKLFSWGLKANWCLVDTTAAQLTAGIVGSNFYFPPQRGNMQTDKSQRSSVFVSLGRARWPRWEKPSPGADECSEVTHTQNSSERDCRTRKEPESRQVSRRGSSLSVVKAWDFKQPL